MLIGRVQTPSGEIVHVRADGERLVQIEDPYAAFAAGRSRSRHLPLSSSSESPRTDLRMSRPCRRG